MKPCTLCLFVACLTLAACRRPAGACWEVPALPPAAGPTIDALTRLDGQAAGPLAGWERRDARVMGDRVELELGRAEEGAHLTLVHPSKGASAATSRYFAVQARAEGTPALALALADLLRARETADPWTWLPRPTSRAVGQEPAPPPAPSAPSPFPWAVGAAGLASLVAGWAAARRRSRHSVTSRAPDAPLPRRLGVPAALAVAGALVVPHVLRWAASGPDSYDLGLFAHALWNAVQGCGFFSSAEGMDHLGWHMSPILWALVPAYAAFGSPLVLLLANGLALALAAWPLWRLARASLPALAALAAAALVLAHPALGSLNRDFHPVALAVPFLLLAVTGAETGRASWLVAGALLAPASEETAALPLMGLGLYLLVGRESRIRGAALLAFGGLALALAFALWLPAFGGDAVPALRRYAALGATWTEVLAAPLLAPTAFWGRLLSEASLGYLVKLLAPLAFLPLLAPRAWLVLLPPLLQVLLADGGALTSLNGHYEALLLPGLALATVQGVARLAARASPRTDPPLQGAPAAAWLLAVPLLAAPFFHANLGRGHFADLAPPPGVTECRRSLAAVPPGMGVASSPRWQARLADRPVAAIVTSPDQLPRDHAPFDALLWPASDWGAPPPGALPAGFAPALATPACTLFLRTEEGR